MELGVLKIANKIKKFCEIRFEPRIDKESKTTETGFDWCK